MLLGTELKIIPLRIASCEKQLDLMRTEIRGNGMNNGMSGRSRGRLTANTKSDPDSPLADGEFQRAHLEFQT